MTFQKSTSRVGRLRQLKVADMHESSHAVVLCAFVDRLFDELGIPLDQCHPTADGEETALKDALDTRDPHCLWLKVTVREERTGATHETRFGIKQSSKMGERPRVFYLFDEDGTEVGRFIPPDSDELTDPSTLELPPEPVQNAAKRVLKALERAANNDANL